MAETRNTFIKSRMNKDLDARILPKGEYRDGLNVAISRSNEDTVGALENVLGNSLITNFGIETFLPQQGSLDPTSFLTVNSTDNNWTPSAAVVGNQISTSGSGFGSVFTVNTNAAGEAIAVKSNGEGGGYAVGDTIVIEGELGNGTATIQVVEVLNYCFDEIEIIGAKEDEASNRMFVFMTNFSDDSFNNQDLKPTVETFNFVCCYDFNSNTPYVLAKGKYLNFSKLSPVIGINVIENFLFWTDDRNQPRKLNINHAISNPNYYDNYEWNISVAKLAPIEPISMVTTFDGSGNPDPAGIYTHTSMVDAVSELLPDGVTANPFYEVGYNPDQDYTEEKFLSFAYRYKYDDNEYSLISPFTQSAFIPKQDGFFIKTFSGGRTFNDDSLRTYKSTEVEFMTNKVNKIYLPLPLPFPDSSGGAVRYWDEVKEKLHIKEIDIIVKESDGISFKKLDTIDIETIVLNKGVTNATPYLYTYTGDKPYETLPAFEYTRVGDIIPIKALAQEVVGNRVVYGNYIDKHTTPADLNFKPIIQDRNDDDEKEYQNQTLKQNRSYQVGLILQDLYGRQSSVILSNYEDLDGKLTSIFHPYRNASEGGTVFANSTNFWYGDTLAIDWTTIIPEVRPEEGYPGLYNGTVGVDYNPLGWVSYRVVVKQEDQDYYNVYYPGLLSGYINPFEAATQEDPIGHFVLHGDNINKIPRDLNAVGPEQNLFKSINVNTKAAKYTKQMEWVPYDSNYSGDMYGILGANHSASGEKEMKIEVEKQVTDKQKLDQIYSDEWERLVEQIREGEGNIPDNTSAKLFPRVVNTSTAGNEQFNYTSGAVGNSSYRPDMVVTIGKGQQLTLFQLPPAGTQITQGNEFYNFATDPLIARTELGTKFLNTLGDKLGFPIPGGAFSPMGVSSNGWDSTTNAPKSGNMAPILAVYETKPAKSRLDLYFETSTSGYISDLNPLIQAADTTSVTNLYDKIGVDLGTPIYTPPVNSGNLAGTFYSESGSFSATTEIIRNFYAANGTTILNLGADGLKVFKAVDGLGNDLTKFFTIALAGGAPNDFYQLRPANNYVPVSYGDARDYIKVFVECTNSSIVTFQELNVIIKNAPPVALSPSTTSGAPYTATWNIDTDGYNSNIITMYGTNGSGNQDLKGQNCFWEIDGSATVLSLFELVGQEISTNPTYFNSNEIGLRIKNTVNADDLGNYTFSVKLKDRDYAIPNPAVYYFDITLGLS